MITTLSKPLIYLRLTVVAELYRTYKEQRFLLAVMMCFAAEQPSRTGCIHIAERSNQNSRSSLIRVRDHSGTEHIDDSYVPDCIAHQTQIVR